MISIFMIVSLIPLLEVIATNKFPPYIQICKRQADMFPCFEKNVNICKQHIAEGIPEFYIPPMNPFVVPKISLQLGTFAMNVKDLQMQGLQNVQLLEMSVNLEGNFTVHILIKLPFLDIRGVYTAKGKLLMLELDGNGIGSGNITDLVATADFSGKKVMRNGLEYADISDGKISLNFSGPVFMYFDNLFGDRNDLTIATNQVIQENIENFVEELQPIIGKVIISVLMGIIKPVHKRYSLDELFPK